MKNVLLFLVISFLLLSSCKDEDAPVRYYTPDMQAPVIPGILLTNEVGQELGIFGNPDLRFHNRTRKYSKINSVEPIMDDLSIGGAFPNPSSSHSNFYFTLESNHYVKIFLVKGAIAPGIDTQNLGLSEIYLASGFSVWSMEKYFPGGSTEITINTEEISRKFGAGFYRIYLDIDGNLAWTDILILNEYIVNNL